VSQLGHTHAHTTLHTYTPYTQNISSQSSIEVKVDSSVLEIQPWNLISHLFMTYIFANFTIEVIFVSALNTHIHTRTNIDTVVVLKYIDLTIQLV